jgi:predicted deacylase
MPRVTECIALPAMSPGTARHIQVHRWGPRDVSRVYIQASLHADEIPGMLVANHLCRLLDEADRAGRILDKEIVIIPFANPIGMSQSILGTHMGRFSLCSGTNFNRAWPDLTAALLARVEGLLTQSAGENVSVIRGAILAELSAARPLREDSVMKHELFKIAATSDIVLDLHCDSDAVMHMYTHDNLWPEMVDLAVGWAFIRVFF